MKQMLTPLLVAVSLLVPMAATASHSPGDGPKLDKADGTVEDIAPTTLHVNAVSNPDGTEPRGHLWYRSQQPGFGPFDEVGSVTCLRVVGNLASVGMRIDRSKLPGFPGEGNGFLFIVQDFGEPGDGTPPDSHVDFFTATPPMVCPPPFVFTFPHKSGNFVVHDAP
jgi:hypothetical protein